MALNYPGPYEVRIFYTVSTLQHEQRLNCRLSGDPDPGAAFNEVTILDADDTPLNLGDVVDDWVALIEPFLKDDEATVDYAELWRYEAESFDATFIGSYDISDAGLSVSGTTQLGGQVIYVFRTAEGGIMKINLIEGVTPAGTRKTFTELTTGGQNLISAVLNGTTPWLARDTSYPIAFIAQYPGQNEAVWKKRFRA